MDPTKQFPPQYLAEDRSRELINVLIAFGFLETFFILLFFTSRFMNHTVKGWDVYHMIPAYIFCMGHIVVGSVMVAHGGAGRHMFALHPNVVVRWIKLDKAEELIYNFSILFPKLSILCFYLRVFSTKTYRQWIYAVGSLVILTCIAGQIVALSICHPFAYFWDKSIKGGHCGNIPAAYRYISVPGLLADVCIITLPLYGVWHLHAKTMQKIGLSITFLTGCIGTVTGIVRLIYFFKINMFEDVTWDAVETMSWTLIEPGVYMIAATLPSLRPLFKWALKDTKISALATSFLDRASRVLSTHRSAKETVAEEKGFAHPHAPQINTKTTITAKSVPKNAKVMGMGMESDSDASSADMV